MQLEHLSQDTNSGYNIAMGYLEACYGAQFQPDRLKGLFSPTATLLHVTDDLYTKYSGIDAIFKFFQANYFDRPKINPSHQTIAQDRAFTRIEIHGDQWSQSDRLLYDGDITMYFDTNAKSLSIDAIEITESYHI